MMHRAVRSTHIARSAIHHSQEVAMFDFLKQKDRTRQFAEGTVRRHFPSPGRCRGGFPHLGALRGRALELTGWVENGTTAA